MARKLTPNDIEFFESMGNRITVGPRKCEGECGEEKRVIRVDDTYKCLECRTKEVVDDNQGETTQG